jgi:oxalate decarboxylase/phosphoglucose isomerase-like protein (cupin superfamily)
MANNSTEIGSGDFEPAPVEQSRTASAETAGAQPAHRDPAMSSIATAMHEPEAVPDPEQRKFLLDPYKDWSESEGIPIHLDFGHQLLHLETGRWDRYDAKGCFAHTRGMGDFMANYVLEVEPGKKTRPVQHIYEAFFFVLSGHGSTVVWLPGGEVRTFEWGPKALFAIPLNCKYQILNASGREPARLSVTNNAPLVINLFHDINFVFDNQAQFPNRVGERNHFEGAGNLYSYGKETLTKVQNIWETNFVNDLSKVRLYALDGRGKGSTNVNFVLADGTMHAHISQMPKGRYKKAHRHAAGSHVHAIDGAGYTLLWFEGDSDFVEVPWEHGFMYSPPFWMYHQHFNTGSQPARYFACSLGSRRYPFIALRRKSAEGGGAESVKKGGRQIEYEDQDIRVHYKFLKALDKTGVPSEMGDIFDEDAIRKLPEGSMTGVIKTPASVGPAT